MDTLLGIAVVAVWIVISVVGLKRAYGPRGASPRKPRLEADGVQARRLWPNRRYRPPTSV